MDIPPMSPFRTARLLLRRAEAADAAPLAALMTDAISARLATWSMPWTAERMAARIAEWSPIGLPCAVERASDGALVGWVHALRARDGPERATMGWWCAEAHRGHGYLREAASALLPLAVSLLDLRVVEAGVQPDNAASLAVMRALGMQLVGERVVLAPARQRQERILLFAIGREAALATRPAPPA
ncbi:GNAT family N-acetyltransferase [Muricoccus radiodurans]|uniref:GNAT family N-acetyltransferase n=1 Tax=Muricoccus radiodurans TaxID=2231721 RepID=UPI003CEBD4C8